jgi:hypothetical protein
MLFKSLSCFSFTTVHLNGAVTSCSCDMSRRHMFLYSKPTRIMNYDVSRPCFTRSSYVRYSQRRAAAPSCSSVLYLCCISLLTSASHHTLFSLCITISTSSKSHIATGRYPKICVVMNDIALEVDMQHSDSDIDTITHTKRILLTAAQEDASTTASTRLSKPRYTQTSVKIVTATLLEDDLGTASSSSLSPQHTVSVSVPHGVVPGILLPASTTLPEDNSYTASSLSLSPHSVPHGVVPGSPRALETTSNQNSGTTTSADCWESTTASYISATTSAYSAETTTTASARSSARRSTYPRPSPPGFLYPEAIVPRSVYENEHAHAMQHPDMLGIGSGSGSGLW